MIAPFERTSLYDCIGLSEPLFPRRTSCGSAAAAMTASNSSATASYISSPSRYCCTIPTIFQAHTANTAAKTKNSRVLTIPPALFFFFLFPFFSSPGVPASRSSSLSESSESVNTSDFSDASPP